MSKSISVIKGSKPSFQFSFMQDEPSTQKSNN